MPNQLSTASGADVLEQYLAPDPQDKEIVILSDSDASSGVMASGRNTIALSSSATQLLRSALLGTGCYDAAAGASQKLRAAIGAGPKWEDAAAWLKESAGAGFFQLSSSPPKVSGVSTKEVAAGSKIPALDGVPLEYGGQLTEATVNQTKVYWFTASISLQGKSGACDCNEIGSVSKPTGPVYAETLLPRIRLGGVGVNCGACGLCGVCGGCGACGLCGGIDLAAALIAVDAVLVSITTVNVAALGSLRAS